MIEVQGAPLDSMIRMTAGDLRACMTAIQKAQAANFMDQTTAYIVLTRLGMARRYALAAVDMLNKQDTQKVRE